MTPSSDAASDQPTRAEVDNYIRVARELPPDGSSSNAAVRRLADDLDRAVALLRKLEWSAGDDMRNCPSCGRRDTFGHEDCPLQQFLRDFPEAPEERTKR